MWKHWKTRKKYKISSGGSEEELITLEKLISDVEGELEKLAQNVEMKKKKCERT